jgi:16S rRNA (cytidine1402-2'-O)-methyltransferase
MKVKGTLYICSTPIGNLEDITIRALRVLKEVDIIACEDTRVTVKLINHYEIKTKLMSYHKFTEKEKSAHIINLLEEGKNIALVSDAGTPLISDPGKELIKQIYSKNLKVVLLPGASAVITAVSANFSPCEKFVFTGFLPRTKNEKEKILKKYSDINNVCFESPSRLVNSLKEIKEILGNRNILVARELTKIYEELKRDSVENLILWYSETPPKGEITLVIEGEPQTCTEKDFIHEKILTLLGKGFSVKDTSKILSSLYDFPHREIYAIALEKFK